MEYILLFIIVAFLAGQTIVNKQFAHKNSSFVNTVLFHAMCTTALTIFFLITSKGSWTLHLPTLLFSIGFAVCFEVTIFAKLIAFSSGAMSLTSLITSFSLILPTFYGIFLLSEDFNAPKIVGLLLLSFSLCLINLNKGEKTKVRFKWVIFVMLAFVGDGFCAIVQKSHQTHFPGLYGNELMLSAGLVASLINWLVFAFFLARSIRPAVTNNRPVAKAASLYGFLNGLLIAAVNMIVIFLSGKLPASLMYPMISAGAVVLSLLISTICYREKLSKLQWAGCICGILAVVFLNL